MSVVQIFAGHYALMMSHGGDGLYDRDENIRSKALSLTVPYVPGFHPERQHRIDIVEIIHVMPKTFEGEYRGRYNKRLWRGEVLACAQSLPAATALKEKLLRIGTDESSTHQTRVRAIYQALPEIFPSFEPAKVIRPAFDRKRNVA